MEGAAKVGLAALSTESGENKGFSLLRLLLTVVIGGGNAAMVLGDLMGRPISHPLVFDLMLTGGVTIFMAVLWWRFGPPPLHR